MVKIQQKFRNPNLFAFSTTTSQKIFEPYIFETDVVLNLLLLTFFYKNEIYIEIKKLILNISNTQLYRIEKS